MQNTVENANIISNDDLIKNAENEAVMPDSDKFVPTRAEEPKKQKKNAWRIILVSAIVVIILIIAGIFLRGAKGGAFEEQRKKNIYAKLTEDGTAYIPCMDGKTIKINEEVQSAMLTKDRRHVVALLQDGRLFYSDASLSEKKYVAENVSTIYALRNDGFFYIDDKDEIYRFRFEDEANICIGEDIALSIAQDTISTVIADGDGKILILGAGESEPKRVGSFENRIVLDEISNDAAIATWVLEDERKERKAIVCEAEEKSTLGVVESTYMTTTFSKDQQMLVVSSSDSSTIWIKKRGSDAVQVRFGKELSSIDQIYTCKGLLEYQDAEDIVGLYILSEADSGDNLYYVTINGERDRVMSKIWDCNVVNGMLIYLDMDNTLFQAKLAGNQTSDVMKIASDVEDFKVSENGRYLYYMKDSVDGTCSLYAYSLNNQKLKKVGSDIACSNSRLYKTPYLNISASGDRIYYFTDLEIVEDEAYGTLTTWDFAKEETKKLSGDVMRRSLSSGLDGGVIIDTGFSFMKFGYKDKDDNIICDWMYYDGKTAERIAQDIIY